MKWINLGIVLAVVWAIALTGCVSTPYEYNRRSEEISNQQCNWDGQMKRRRCK